MKRAHFVIFFIAMHILFIVLQIHKQSKFIKLSYQKQRLEKEKQQLITEQHQLTQQLYALQDYGTIKTYATNTLQMQKINLKQIKKVSV